MTLLKAPFVRRKDGKKPVEGEAFVPEVLYQGKYYPICGHYFWDTDDGATSVCKALGFSSGKVKKTQAKYTVDAMPVGVCKSGEPLDKCTGSGNAWGNLDYRSGSCKKGNSIGVQVICEGTATNGCTEQGGGILIVFAYVVVWVFLLFDTFLCMYLSARSCQNLNVIGVIGTQWNNANERTQRIS